MAARCEERRAAAAALERADERARQHAQRAEAEVKAARADAAEAVAALQREREVSSALREAHAEELRQSRHATGPLATAAPRPHSTSSPCLMCLPLHPTTGRMLGTSWRRPRRARPPPLGAAWAL